MSVQEKKGVMRVCVLESSYDHSQAPTKDLDPSRTPKPWMPEYEFEHVGIHKATAVAQVRDLVQSGKYDLFCNLCDGAWDEDRAGIEVVQTLERFEVPFTGAESSFYEPTREHMKMIARYAGALIPAYAFVYNEKDVDRACKEVRLPAIVKHFNGYNSIGMTKDSRCETVEALRAQIQKMLTEYGGALVEEFIEGREFTVLVSDNPADSLQPIVYPPVEVNFPEGETFKHFNLKWKDYDGMGYKDVTDADLAKKLCDITRNVYLTFKGSSYARLDFRGDKDGNVYFLEVNPQCGIFYAPETPGSADCILLRLENGHRQFANNIFNAALQRHARRKAQKRVEVRYSSAGGFGLYATVDLQPGDLVLPGEGRPVYPVTHQHVKSKWTQQDQNYFLDYAWPLSPRMSVAWSDKPEDWRPFNHSCDPNCWLEGLDTVARRSIPAGSELTIDYCTFTTDFFRTFDCACGAQSCRGRISKDDIFSPALIQQYGSHFSDYVVWRQEMSGLRPVTPSPLVPELDILGHGKKQENEGKRAAGDDEWVLLEVVPPAAPAAAPAAAVEPSKAAASSSTSTSASCSTWRALHAGCWSGLLSAAAVGAAVGALVASRLTARRS